MRFDPDRALALVARFSTLRPAGSDAERAAADAVAEELARAGLDVRRGELAGVIPIEARAAEVWPTAVLAIAAGVVLQLAVGSGPGRLSPWLLAGIFAALVAVAVVVHLAARGLRLGRSVALPYVVARPGRAGACGEDGTAPPRGEDGAPPPRDGLGAPGARGEDGLPARDGAAAPRVVFLTHLDTRPPVAAYRFRRDLELLEWVWLGVLWVPCLIVGGWAWLATAGPALLIGLGLIGLVRRLDPWVQAREPYPADNRTGLALLVELARSWPRDAGRSPEVSFVAASMLATPEAWREMMGPSGPGPTLVVNLEAPGVGTVLGLAGRDGVLARAERAARDLWLPARAVRWSCVPLDHRAIRAPGVEGISLVGDLDAARIEPTLLAAAAQLATELALRQARPADPRPAPEPTPAPGGPGA